MSNKKTKDIVIGLLARGHGRRRIAKELGITEWAARQIISEILGDSKEQRHDAKKQPKPSVKKVRSKSEIKQSKGTSATTIKVGSSAQSSPIKHKKVKRPCSIKVAVLSDIHYPYQDEKACEVADMFLEDYKPDVLVYNGDVADCYSVSSYEKSYKKKMNIQEELDYTHEKLKERFKRLPSIQETYFVEGNHENRFNRAIQAGMSTMGSLRGLSIQHSMGLDELDITYVPSGEELKIGKLLFTHGHMARKHAGNTARGHYEQYGCSVIIGHVHRLSVSYKRNKFGNHAMIENGTLCDFDVEYMKYPDWQHGFTTIDFDGDDFVATSRPIIGYKLIANEKVYAI